MLYYKGVKLMKKTHILMLSILSWVAMFVFMIVILPIESNRLFEATQVTGSPDTSFILSTSELEDLIRAYGEQGRIAYVQSRIRFDILWPLVYTAALYFPILLFSKNQTKRKWWVFPLLAMGFDLLENLFASILMIQFPLFSNGLAVLLILASLLKWFFLSVSFLILIWLLTIRIFYQNQHQKGQTQ